MGYPSENVESIYRNALDDVRRLLEEKHKVINLQIKSKELLKKLKRVVLRTREISRIFLIFKDFFKRAHLIGIFSTFAKRQLCETFDQSVQKSDFIYTQLKIRSSHIISSSEHNFRQFVLRVGVVYLLNFGQVNEFLSSKKLRPSFHRKTKSGS